MSLQKHPIEIRISAEEPAMSVYDRFRALMNRHHHLIKNRQQSLLTRTAAEVGLPEDIAQNWNHIQGKPSHNSTVTYDRSGAAMS